MPETAETTAPVQDLGRTPTLLESIASQMDITGAPQIKPKELPRITEQADEIDRGERKDKKPPENKAEEPKPETDEEKKTREDKEKTTDAEWKKASETVAEKLFKKRGPKEPPKKEEKEEKAEKPAETKVDEEKVEVKPEEKKTSKRRERASEAEITERAAAAAAEAATNAVAKLSPKPEERRPEPVKRPEENLTTAERRQFDVYQELESSQPERYKGVTGKFIKSLADIQDYKKTWAKDNPGQKFDPDAEEHNDFFARVEPEVDQDDWDDARTNIRARQIASESVKPLNEKMQAMEQERARAAIEPFIQQKSIEGVTMLLNEFDQELAAKIRTPEGVKELTESDPITAGILNHTAGIMTTLAAEIVRLHDETAGIPYNPQNPVHKEIADFIVGQEARISKLPLQDRTRDGKRFIGRLAYRQLPPEEKGNYWFLGQDDITYLLAQKYALEAKRIRDSEVEKFNKTAEKLGYKKIDGAKPGAKPAEKKQEQPPKPKETPGSPEAVSRTSLKTAGGGDAKPAPGNAEAILGGLFQRLRS